MTAPDNRQSYLAAGINAISPWGSRNTTPKTKPAPEDEQPSELSLASQRGGDHTVSHRHRLSLKKYPKDCPPLNVQWFHAVDIPKRKALPFGGNTPAPEKPPVPKKWNTFSSGDSRALEATFQKLSDEAEAAERQKQHHQGGDLGDTKKPEESLPNWRLKERHVRWERKDRMLRAHVPVNEDFLFDVDVEERELLPAYWQGPIYEVRRGTWFYQDSATSLRPCDENLAMQLEEGYLKVKPWRFGRPTHQRSTSQPKAQLGSSQPGEDQGKTISRSSTVKSTQSSDPSKAEQGPEATGKEQGAEGTPAVQEHPKTHRLFGAHMNSVVTYQDATTAWQLTDDFLSRMSSTMYQRFAGGGHFAGVKLIRGFVDLKSEREKAKKAKPKDEKEAEAENKTATPSKQSSATAGGSSGDQSEAEAETPSETRRRTLERQMSNLMSAARPDDPEKQEEEVRKRAEREIRDDYKEQEGDEQGRDIEHLLLVTHGIGQRLGMRMESVNFVHDVNTLRKTLKTVYTNSADLQALNSEVDKLPKNCRVQVLPIVWRHLLDFPKQSLKHNREEFDLGDAHVNGEDEFPSLEDITVEGVPAVRNLITDLALDVLLFQSPAYKNHITRIVLQECNRIYGLFKERNPSFDGKVSLVGHSLGSAIMFEILCHQKEEQAHRERHKHHHQKHRSEDQGIKLDFEVEDFYALGSPIGLFQMLSGRTIAARGTHFEQPIATSDPFLDEPAAATTHPAHLDITTSSPKCQRVFNIFHPTDPISYRLEPLISPAMSTLKPQPLPYTKKGIFGAPVGQGLTGIGARVGQSVSGLWSSFSSGIASSLLNRSLGLSADDASKLGNPVPGQQSRVPLSVSSGAGPNASAAGGPQAQGGGGGAAGSSLDAEAATGGDDRKRKLAQDGSITVGDEGQRPQTLIDGEIETLYSGFQKRRKSQQAGMGEDGDTQQQQQQQQQSAEWQEMEERSRKLRREEAKVRALNSNGRVDYSIQEGAFDISLLASIASHLSYYADEDVSHFMISQLLARHRVIKKVKSAPDFKV